MENQKQTGNQLGNRAKSGLTILLHGGPGTGKTFTATCVAEVVKRPLLLGSVETDSSIADLEQSINQGFQLAARWGAILLLEDVESFLAERWSSKSTKPLAPFNKAIQAIDKHSGILFLTTCRVGLLDAAILSRIDYAVTCLPLSLATNHDIMLRMLHEDTKDDYDRISYDSAKDLIDSKGLRGLNGRDIQSVILAARQIAVRQGGHLRSETIWQLLQDKNEFKNYFAEAHAQSERARRDMLRSDQDV